MQVNSFCLPEDLSVPRYPMNQGGFMGFIFLRA